MHVCFAKDFGVKAVNIVIFVNCSDNYDFFIKSVDSLSIPEIFKFYIFLFDFLRPSGKTGGLNYFENQIPTF